MQDQVKMAHNEAPVKVLNLRTMDFEDNVDNPTTNLSGSLFVSGGALFYSGFADTVTEVAGS